MQLMHIKYKDGLKETFRLGLFIKNENDIVTYLDSKYVSMRDVNLIRGNVQILDRMTPGEILEWLKKNVPDSYKRAYRTAKQANCEIIKKTSVALPIPRSSPSVGDQNKTS